MISSGRYESSVFINCPYDEEYLVLLRAIIFTINLPGLIPRLSVENGNSACSRLSYIESLISSSKYSIHDISRMTTTKEKPFARMNMPFELGMDFGCRCYSHDDKIMLILDEQKYRYQQALSDLSGMDICYHCKKELTVINVVRDWIVDTIKLNMPGGDAVWGWYKTDFPGFLLDEAKQKDMRQEEMYNCSILQYKEYVSSFFDDFLPIQKYRGNIIL